MQQTSRGERGKEFDQPYAGGRAANGQRGFSLGGVLRELEFGALLIGEVSPGGQLVA